MHPLDKIKIERKKQKAKNISIKIKNTTTKK
jgi:hypothetical protein